MKHTFCCFLASTGVHVGTDLQEHIHVSELGSKLIDPTHPSPRHF